jgi:hypothetical protein
MKNKTLKNIGALFLGFLITVILTLVTDLILFKAGIMKTNPFSDNPSWMIVVIIIYRCIYNTTGSYFTAKFAAMRPLRLAMIGGYIGLVISLTGLIVKWDVPPHWYGIALVLTALPCAWTGGKLFESKNKIVYHG